MKTKRIAGFAIGLLLTTQTTFAATPQHRHDWRDDVENSTDTTNVYCCSDCGAVKYEDVSSIRDYVITLDANGGEVETDRLITHRNKVKLPIPYHTSDYQWDGWFTEPEGGEEITSDFVYEGDTTLYAHWSVVGTRTLTFASDGGSFIRPITRPCGSVINLAGYTPIKTGYLFDGWYADPRTKQQRVTEAVLDENVVVYAKWRIDETQVQPDTLMTTDPIYLTDKQLAERIERVKERLRLLLEQMKTE